jgi:hemerythrin
MEKIVWTPEWSVGVDVFDEHHKQVILMINRLIDVQAASQSETVSDLLDRMTRYAQDHLKAEEKMMVEHDYPDYEEHKAQHIAYIKKTVDFCTASQIGIDAIPIGLLAYLGDWWKHHIQTTDKAYTAFFSGIGIQ